MITKEEDNNWHIKREYLVAHLLDFFRDPSQEKNFLHAASIAFNQLSSQLKDSHFTHDIYEQLLYHANNLKNNLTPVSLRYFANQCMFYYIKNNKHKKSSKNMLNQAKDKLSFLLSCGHSPEASLQRTSQYLLKNNNTTKQHKLTKLIANHPLKDVLLPYDIAQKNLAKEDIKQHFLKLKPSMLFMLLTKAQVFSVPRLHSLLGDDLFFLCKPLGFMKDESIVIIKTPTNAHLHALIYKKNHIIQALKQDPAFNALKNIRLEIG